MKLREPVISYNDSRFYLVGDRYVPSITTILSFYKQDIIKQWQEKVGIEEAEKIKNLAAASGTRMHDGLEEYINLKWINDADTKPLIDRLKKRPITYMNFKKIKDYLDQNLTSVSGIETQLHSTKLKTAGRMDLRGGWKHVESIIDFKSSKWEKKKEHIETYFLQTTAYSIMLQEMTGIKIEQLVILFSTQSENFCYEYIEHRDNYIHKLVEVINHYYKENKELIFDVNAKF